MGEERMNQVERFLGHKTSVCRTADEPLVGAKLASPFSGILPPEVTREAVSHFCKNEWAIHLDDVMVRRTSWRYYHRNHLEIAETVAKWMASFLGWSDDMIREELQSYHSA